MKWLKNSFLVCLSVCFTLLLIEGALILKNLNMKNYDIEMWKYSKQLKQKSSNPILGHEHIQSKCSTLQSIEICLDQSGLRSNKIQHDFQGRKILFLGSSITLGWGVDQDKMLTSLIQDDFIQNEMKVQIINAGIGNYNTVRYVEGFFQKLTHLEPTDIVVHYFINDAETLGEGNNNVILRNSQLAATLWMIYQQFSLSLQQTSLVDHYNNSYDEKNRGFLSMKQALTRLANYAKKRNINLYLTMTPDIHFLEDYPFGSIHKTMEKLSMDLGYTYIDLYPDLKGIPFEKLQIIPGDAHPNAYGHSIMAKSIFEKIK